MTPGLPQSEKRLSLILWLVAGAALLGVAPVTVKALPFDAEVSAFYRVLLATPFMLLICAFNTTRASPVPKNGRFYGLTLLAVILFTADLTVMHFAIKRTDVAIATLLTNCAPFFVVLMGIAGIVEKPKVTEFVCLLVAIGGMYVLCILDKPLTHDYWGEALALLAAFFYAAYIVTIKKVREYECAPALIMLFITVGCSLLLFPVFILSGAPLPGDLSTWALLLALVLCGQVLGQLLVTRSLKGLSASFSSIVLLLQPVTATALSWSLLDETLTPLELAGMAIILAAIAASALLPPKSSNPLRTPEKEFPDRNTSQ
ncbi:DMT family transporter [Pseudomonas gingeri]|uniref:DMT family transporter n=1 Tax=Pseudomonas gingeri TaxID=117681 RepID=UPI0015A481C8|nr:DMT family transporter [Pseudomonas gingeri]NWA29155.1 DMT family transporter [Pseudomonas gingeri]NWD72267.1 DMT family transporter [Pseudomonas gingeri]NWD76540.1 DMT family transporter [Pseudomonas gingeri]